MDNFTYSEADLFTRCYEIINNHKNSANVVSISNPVKPIIEKKNRKTQITNFPEVCASLERDIDEVMKFILSELSIQGSITETNVLLLNGMYKPSQVMPIIVKYINTRVCCHQCKSRHTNIVKENRITYLKCGSCFTKNAIE